MILGIGVDIVEVQRIQDTIRRQPAFLQRVFTPAEIEYCWPSERQRYARLASRFAAKEAALKALGSGLRQAKWVEMEVRRDQLGKPSVRLSGQLAERAARMGITELLVSISHGKDYAVAQVVALGSPE